MKENLFEEADETATDPVQNGNDSDPKSLRRRKLKKIKNFLRIYVLAIVLSVLFFCFYRELQPFVKYFLIVCYSLSLGIYFWLIREKFKITYALIELLAGLSAIFAVFNSLVFSLSLKDWQLQNYMGLVGGLYILVRAVDNLSNTRVGMILADLLADKKK